MSAGHMNREAQPTRAPTGALLRIARAVRLARARFLLLRKPPRRQAGVIPWRRGAGGELEFLLVTSRNTGRWVFPKGGLMEGLAPWESGAQEALEEAGVAGRVETTPLGAYLGLRIRPSKTSPVKVTLYAMEVTRELDEWQEKDQRERRWANADETAVLVSDAGVARLTRVLARRLGA